MSNSITVGFLHRPRHIGGPGSFQVRLAYELDRIGHRTILMEDDQSGRPDVLLLIGAPVKDLARIIRWKLRGGKVIQRLAGPYWRHRVQQMPQSERLEHMIRNQAMLFQRNKLADHVIYQSQFVQKWWHSWHGPAPCPETVIVNGVDLQEFIPSEKEDSNICPILLVVEGELHPTPMLLDVLATIPSELYVSGIVRRTEVYGQVAPEVLRRLGGVPSLDLIGPLPREQMPGIFGRRGIYLSMEVNPPCPNAVLEALASGMPVVGFDTGAMSELVSSEAGKVVSYGGDPWKLDRPDVTALDSAVREVAEHLQEYRYGARALACQKFSLETMATRYVDVFTEVLRRL